MQTYGALFQHELEKLVVDKINTLRTQLESPQESGRTDFIRGQIYALREINGLMDQASDAANQENR